MMQGCKLSPQDQTHNSPAAFLFPELTERLDDYTRTSTLMVVHVAVDEMIGWISHEAVRQSVEDAGAFPSIVFSFSRLPSERVEETRCLVSAGNVVRRRGGRKCQSCSSQVKPLIRVPVRREGCMDALYGSWQKPHNPTSSSNTTCHCVRGATGMHSVRAKLLSPVTCCPVGFFSSVLTPKKRPIRT